MKRIFVFLTALLGFGILNAQTSQEALELKETEHDFGRIPQNKPVFYSFEVMNRTDKPVKIENVSASCGCTTPEWSREEIPAGGSTKIKVGFNSAAEGYFERYITLTYNQSVQKQIMIKGTVWKTPTGAAPANASLQFLKQQIQ
jgi:hypothetical protein